MSESLRAYIAAQGLDQVCEQPLTPKWLRDPQLGPCCLECAPFVVNADKLLRSIRIAR
jgi:hypothetical protein